MKDKFEELLDKHCSREPYVDVDEVAALLKLNKWTVYKKAKRGEIPCHRFGKSLRFKISEICSS